MIRMLIDVIVNDDDELNKTAHVLHDTLNMTCDASFGERAHEVIKQLESIINLECGRHSLIDAVELVVEHGPCGTYEHDSIVRIMEKTWCRDNLFACIRHAVLGDLDSFMIYAEAINPNVNFNDACRIVDSYVSHFEKSIRELDKL